jgi:arabinose-5-phosphate isomerase
MATPRDSNPHPDERIERAREVVRLEAQAIAALESRLDGRFSEACAEVLRCEGHVVVSGMGKAGLIGQKISATLASTGTPSIFLHPGEALHGDLGRIRAQDVVLAMSNSGETDELNALVPVARRIGARVIALTGNGESTLAKRADAVLDFGAVEEACPMKLAPTASTTAMLALGDALAMVVLSERGFDREDYALYHPAGALGRRLMRIAEVMRSGDELPLVRAEQTVSETLITMTQTPGRPGAALVVDEAGVLAGIFTDGDLRRLLQEGRREILDASVSAVMGRDPKSVQAEQLVEEAKRIMQESKVDQVPVVDEAGRAVGLLDVQDLLEIRL